MKPVAFLALALSALAPVSCEKPGQASTTTPPPLQPASNPVDYSSTSAATPRVSGLPAAVPGTRPALESEPGTPKVSSVGAQAAPYPATKPMPEKPDSPDAKFKDQIEKLTPIQRYVTQESGTERAFTGEYWNNHEPGIYVDIVSNKPLFSSLDKFDSGCGWPSFAKTLAKDEVKELTDNSHGMVRTEVRSSTADSHLGHVFDDGPEALGGLRYCINSASIRFIHQKDLDKEGFGEYKKLFEKKEEAKP